MAEKLEKLEKKVDEKLTVAEMYANRPRKWWVYTLVVLIIAALVGWSGSTVQFEGLTVTGRSVAQGVISGITHPDLKRAQLRGPDLEKFRKQVNQSLAERDREAKAIVSVAD